LGGGGGEPEATKGYYNPALLNTGLPIIRIDTAGGQAITSKETYTTANIIITDPQNSTNNITATTGIRGRGNTTWGKIKKPYRLKFDEKKSLFGLTKAKSWVLLANYQDPTLLMNTVAFELGQRLGLPYTNHYVHVELVLNGVYEGSYLLTEQVQVGSGRVDIDEDNGFLVEIDHYYDEEPKFTTINYSLPVMIKSPEDLGNISDYDFVKVAVNGLTDALVNSTFPENGYRDLIDMDTFVDFLLVNEIVGNGEIGWPKSTYMYKDIGGKISMGPLWDFDWGYGYSGNGNVYWKNYRFRNGVHAFFARLFQDPVFRTEYKSHWNAKYADILSIDGFIDTMAQKLYLSQTVNFTVWQWKNKLNYQTEITKMKLWLRNRIEYLNEEINNS
jgi:hypothetical protein